MEDYCIYLVLLQDCNLGNKWPTDHDWIVTGYDDQSRVIRAMSDFHQLTCVKFVKRTTERDFIFIKPGFDGYVKRRIAIPFVHLFISSSLFGVVRTTVESVYYLVSLVYYLVSFIILECSGTSQESLPVSRVSWVSGASCKCRQAGYLPEFLLWEFMWSVMSNCL